MLKNTLSRLFYGLKKGKKIRKQFIVKPFIQIKLLAITLLVVFTAGLVMYFNLWYCISTDPNLEHLSYDYWQALKTSYTYHFVIVLAALMIGFGIDSIFLFHRFAGPLFSIERKLEEISRGNLNVDFRIRRHDSLQKFAAGLQTMLDAIKQKIQEDRQKTEKIVKEIDEGKLIEAKKDVSTLTNSFMIS